MENAIIKTRNIDYSYSKSIKSIDNLSLNIPKGSIYGFLGPNGAGKTTTIRILLGLLKADKGSVSIFGKDINDDRLGILKNIGSLIETPTLYEHLSAFDNLKVVATYKGNYDKEEILGLLHKVNLQEVKDKKVRTFSLGMKQRLAIALSLLNDPQLIILDEPTNGLDPEGIIEIRTLIKKLNLEEGATVLISSHLLNEIEKTCSHIGIIQKGKLLFEGSLKELKQLYEKNINVTFEVDDPALAKEILLRKGIEPVKPVENTIIFTINQKKEIAEISDYLRTNGVMVYQSRINNDLEDLFINLTR